MKCKIFSNLSVHAMWWIQKSWDLLMLLLITVPPYNNVRSNVTLMCNFSFINHIFYMLSFELDFNFWRFLNFERICQIDPMPIVFVSARCHIAYLVVVDTDLQFVMIYTHLVNHYYYLFIFFCNIWKSNLFADNVLNKTFVLKLPRL